MDIKYLGLAHYFLKALIYVFFCIVIPYIIIGLYYAIIDRDNTIRLINYNSVISDEENIKAVYPKLTLCDNNGVMKLSLSLSNLFYIESNDNYIIVWYTDAKAILRRDMIRCCLKNVQESFQNSPLLRCHRKYIVNMQKVKQLIKEKDSYFLTLSNDEIPRLNITKTYLSSVLEYCEKNNISY